MKLDSFQILNYRNIKDSGWIDVNSVTAFVGQNEAGKSNLFEALYRINPFIPQDVNYNLNEDWPADDWGNKPKNPDAPVVCQVRFALSDEEISDLLKTAKKVNDEEEKKVSDTKVEPESLILEGFSYYGAAPNFKIQDSNQLNLDEALVNKWIQHNLPKFVYIKQYDFSGSQVELEQLNQRVKSADWNTLNYEDQAIWIILQLAQIDIDDLLQKSNSPDGRTVRAFDTRSASGYLSNQFRNLWKQKDVRFDIVIDGPTLNIFVEDEGMGMPIRLRNRSTGFRWYVSFAWKFTHASGGHYKNCILLLEEPGVHLHFDGQQDLLSVFERLSQSNTILYTTHLASMVDLKNPERIRIVESINNHGVVKAGIVSSQKSPMAVIEASLGLTGSLSGLLGNRQTLIVEGGDDALIIQKLSGLLKINGRNGLSDSVYLWPATGAPKTPMYAGFAVGNKWDAGVLLDTDEAGNRAKEKIQALYLDRLAEDTKFFILQIGKAAGIPKTDSAIEDLFPDDFYLDCVNSAYHLSIRESELPIDGSSLITNRIEEVLKNRHNMKALDKGRVMGEMLKRFDKLKTLEDLPSGTLEKVEKLFVTINTAFEK